MLRLDLLYTSVLTRALHDMLLFFN